MSLKNDENNRVSCEINSDIFEAKKNVIFKF